MYGRVIVGLAAVVVLMGVAYDYGYSRAALKAAQTHTEVQKRQTAALAAARASEQKLQTKLAQTQQEANDENRRITARYERTIAGLRQRPETRAGSSGVPEGAAAGIGCTGTGLARPDGEFLAGYARDAARLETALKTCVAAYNSVRDQVNQGTP